MSTGLGRRLLPPAVLAGVLLVVIVVSPPALLTITPPVYHDEYDLLSPAVGFVDGAGLTMPLFGSTPALARAFGGEGDLTPGIGAGFHLTLALWFQLFGIGIAPARAFVFLLGLAVLTAVFCLGTRWGSPWVGLAAALMLGLDGTFWYASRQVRPETFTAAAYLTGACLLSLRNERWRNRTAGLAGLAIGLGLCGHPFGIVMAPALLGLVFMAARGVPPVRYLLRLGVPLVLVMASYGAFLGWNWHDVQENLVLNTLHRGIVPLSLTERLGKEWERYGGGYLNAYAQGPGVLVRAAAAGGWILLVACALVGRVRKPRYAPFPAGMTLFAVAPPAAVVIMGILSRDTANFLYLVHFLVWFYLAGAVGIVSLGRWLFHRRCARLRPWAATAGYTLLVVLAVLGVSYYRRELAPYAEHPVMPYQEVERLLAAHLPRGAFVIANETAWLAARTAGAEFVFNKQYMQYLPAYRRYPARATFDGSHLIDYELDVGMLEELRAAGIQIFCVADMWDWSWNLYAPFGRYAPSFLGFQKQLDEFFLPVVRIYTRDRGFVSLYTFAPDSGRPVGEQAIYLEGRLYQLGPEVPPTRPLPQGMDLRLDEGGRTTSIAEFALKPGQPYLLHLNLSVAEGSTVVPVWNNAGLPKHLDARMSIPLDRVVYADRENGRLALLPYPVPAIVRVDRLAVRELVETRPD